MSRGRHLAAGKNTKDGKQKIALQWSCSGHADAHLPVLLLSNKFLCSEAKGVKSVNIAQTSQEGVQCLSYFVEILVDDFSVDWERSTVRQKLFPRFFK